MKKKEKKKKKKIAHIVSFDEDEAKSVVESKQTAKHDKDNISVGSEDVFRPAGDSVHDGSPEGAVHVVTSRASSQRASLDRVSSTVSSVSMASSDLLSSDRCSRSSHGSFSSAEVDDLG